MHPRKASSLLQSASPLTYWPSLVSTSQEFPVDKYKNHPGSRFTDGDPLGFWPQYGLTIICYPTEGLKPFDELFTSIPGTTLGRVVLAIAVPPIVEDSNAGYVPPFKRIIANAQSQDITLGRAIPLDHGNNDEDDDDEAAQEECMIVSSHPTNYEPCP